MGIHIATSKCPHVYAGVVGSVPGEISGRINLIQFYREDKKVLIVRGMMISKKLIGLQ